MIGPLVAFFTILFFFLHEGPSWVAWKAFRFVQGNWRYHVDLNPSIDFKKFNWEDQYIERPGHGMPDLVG